MEGVAVFVLADQRDHAVAHRIAVADVVDQTEAQRHLRSVARGFPQVLVEARDAVL